MHVRNLQLICRLDRSADVVKLPVDLGPGWAWLSSGRGAPEPRTRVPGRRHRLFSTPIDGAEKWKTTGTVNPGLIWTGKFIEIGVEATGVARQLPVKVLRAFRPPGARCRAA
jgi:hypothetical protein